ncbi:hypothetical protein CCH79_00014078 [Gambusia affinis]|uniref:C2H2-type domain-containing protein n=1 Tax=Gambusia affinis TaxID=33528 RepID=A0A315WBZ1_GAMAF|nr:hypothetical protein CCH79_00014078 [Gambusia affinis]
MIRPSSWFCRRTESTRSLRLKDWETGNVFTQHLLDPRDDLLLTRLDQNLDQNLLLEPSCHVEVKAEETRPALDAAEIIEFTYSSRPSARLCDGVHPVADPDPDVPVVLSSDTEDSDDYSKGSPDPGSAPDQPSRHGDGFSCQACSRAFNARRFLFRHVRGHLRDPTPVCGLCGEQFDVPRELQLHLQTHSRKKVLKNQTRTQSRARRLQQVSDVKEPEAQKEENPNRTGVKKRNRGRPRSDNQNPDTTWFRRQGHDPVLTYSQASCPCSWSDVGLYVWFVSGSSVSHWVTDFLAVEVALNLGEDLLGVVVSVLPPRLVVFALFGATSLLQTDLPLTGLQDLLSLCLSLKHLQNNTEHFFRRCWWIKFIPMVDSPEEICSSVASPLWEPHASTWPLSWIRRLYSALSLTWRQSKCHSDSDSAEETLLRVLVGSEHLDAQRGLTLFEQEVPDVQHTLHLHSEEDRRSHWTPAGVHQRSEADSYLVHMMEDSLMSSDQMRAVQSPTVRKFLGKKGFL